MDVKILMSGDQAVSVQMGDEISLEVNRKVLMLHEELKKKPVEGIREMVPTYASLMIHYRPEVIGLDQLMDEIYQRVDSMQGIAESKKIIREVPIFYGGETGPDLELCAQLENTTVEEIIRKHSSHDYYVYMLGFAPGHPYSARFEEPFSFKRRDTARVKIPAGSVVVQLNLSDLIPFEQPCGWNIIGSTPLTICDYKKEDPFLVHAGEWIRYIPVSKKEYDQIKRADEAGTYKVKVREE
ncbi:MAG: allophanate hydrolase subunit 1 [Lachnospiraceae bacterium]|nr:allophanate hydrolase subunit 1 [Lachnospiraceae bacterium]MDY4769377.1 allophanate hydrolase subunit 1 [Lachnospiraceae bacterium]